MGIRELINVRRSGLCANRRGSFFRLSLRRSFGSQLLPIAPFLQARAHHANLRFLFNDKRCAALRARLSDGHVWRREVAIRIARASIENSRTSASAFTGAATPNEFSFVALRAFDAHGDRPCFFTKPLPHSVHFSSSGWSGWRAFRVPSTSRRVVLQSG